MRPLHPRLLILAPILAGLLVLPAQCRAWTTQSRIDMADFALRVAPPDLVRQIERHHKRYHAGIKAAAKSDPANRSARNQIDPTPIVEAEVERAIQSIVDHQPFSEIVFRLGVVSYWVAAVNDPSASAADAAAPPAYSRDYIEYLQDASQRFAVLYYGHDRRFETSEELEALLRRAGERRQSMVPQVAAEYRRIGAIDGKRLFDDRSTAFGIGSVAFSHSVSDIAGVLRYIWLAAGGADTLHLPPLDQDHLILVGRGERSD